MLERIPERPPPIGQSAAFLDLMDAVSRAAPLARPVLVIGERGTGKELIAARLHFLSRRWDQAFVKLNCAALPETLLETELFGHEAGAFTGAVGRRLGRFELADGGSLFLDEIAGAGPAVQEKILRVIEYGEFERVGSSATRRVDVRVIGATNVDLPSAATQGEFRHDLLDRLAFDVLTVPPLRHREGDVALLAEHFARAFARELGRDGFAGFTEAALAALAGHAWPGNVRELKNVVERAVYRAEPDRPVAELVFDPFASPYRPTQPDEPVSGPEAAAKAAGPVDFKAAVRSLERELLQQALAASRYNRRAAAARLGLTYDQLRNYSKKHGLV